ncbi:hypothetical protein F511_38041 [Dorcoceras hygrometricum]|uniref:CCHC-type domain-containing protein n=1 Tax=Dorcoceras hygrometricum TaxID=472368 RepID=A0A2Z7CQN1_9LAMI|nr:hypothetical protein F511_38041 [Dorcoceras hygrometricum]
MFVGTYIAKNKSVSKTTEKVTEEPVLAKVVTETAKRRLAPTVEPVAKKKRTTVGRAAPTLGAPQSKEAKLPKENCETDEKEKDEEEKYKEATDYEDTEPFSKLIVCSSADSLFISIFIVFIKSADALYINRCIPIEIFQPLDDFFRKFQLVHCLPAGLRSRRARRQQAAPGGRSAIQGAQSSQSSQSAYQPQQQQQPQVAQQSGRQRFRPRGQQFKKKLGSGSSGSGSSSSSGSRAEFCGFCDGKHPSTQCVGVQGSCNLCVQYGHFARVCPLAGSQHTTAQPQGRGGQSRGRSPQFSSPDSVSVELLSPFSFIASAFYSCCSLLFYSCSSYWGLTPCPSGAWLFSLFVLFSGNPGFTAGRGFNPAGGAQEVVEYPNSI